MHVIIKGNVILTLTRICGLVIMTNGKDVDRGGIQMLQLQRTVGLIDEVKQSHSIILTEFVKLVGSPIVARFLSFKNIVDRNSDFHSYPLRAYC